MSQTVSNYLEDAKEAKEVAKLLKAAYIRMNAFLKRNTTFSWDHANATKPDYIQEDVDGNIKGVDFNRTELGNAVGTMNTLATIVNSGGLSDAEMIAMRGNHWGNIEKLADA